MHNTYEPQPTPKSGAAELKRYVKKRKYLPLLELSNMITTYEMVNHVL